MVPAFFSSLSYVTAQPFEGYKLADEAALAVLNDVLDVLKKLSKCFRWPVLFSLFFNLATELTQFLSIEVRVFFD